MARDTQFSSAPYSGSYGSAGSSQYGLAVPGSYYGPVAVPARDDAAQDYARTSPGQTRPRTTAPRTA